MKFVPLVLSTAALLAGPGIALAQDSRGQAATPSVEIMPYVSVGSSAASGVGTSVRWSVAPKLSIELDTALREAEVTGLNSSVSLVYDLPSIGRLTPYVAGGVGFEQYGAVVESPVQGLVTVKKTTFTVNAGGGIRMPIDDKWGVRTDARWSNGIGMQAPERWRVYNGVTFATGGRAK
jgi:opacity protein-like surface antigen